jgi:hypothetical protein
MPYVNIPESKLTAVIAKQIGKIQGDITGKVLIKLGNLESQFRSQGCPSGLSRKRRQLEGIQSSLNSINSRISKFRRIPRTLKPPISGLKAALKIILSIPLPQGIGIPPGPAGGLILGLPVNITTKYADTMHLVKEFIKQLSDDIDGISHIVSVDDFQLKSIDRAMKKIQFSLKACEIEKEINERLSEEEQRDLDLLDKDGNSVFRNLSKDLLSNGLEKDSRSVSQIASELNITPEEAVSRLGEDNQDAFNRQVKELGDNIKGISDKDLQSKLRESLDIFRTPTPIEQSSDIFSHIGPDGTIYKLEIQSVPEDSSIAPRRFALARNVRGIAVIKGELSFSSSTKVLLDEIKFRIDNQLP